MLNVNSNYSRNKIEHLPVVTIKAQVFANKVNDLRLPYQVS